MTWAFFVIFNGGGGLDGMNWYDPKTTLFLPIFNKKGGIVSYIKHPHCHI